MSRIVQVLLRGSVLLWTLLITALIGNVIASNINGSSSATKALNYTMFTAAWSWVAGLVGLAAIFVSFLEAPYIMLPLDALAVIFTFVAAILVAAKLRAVNCGNWRHRRLPVTWIAFGSRHTERRCREIQASEVFLWFLWASFVGCLIFTALRSRGGFGRFRSSRPSQV